MADDLRLQEIFDAHQKYASDGEDAFEKFLTGEFFHYGPQDRIAILMGFDKKLEMESAPSRATADLITKRRRMEDMHRLLERGNR